MTAFGPDRADEVLARCQAAKEMIGSALSVAFGGKFKVRPAQPAGLNQDALPEYLDGAGLIFGIAVGETRCLAVLSQADGLLPPWCSEPDAEGDRTLEQLVDELANVFVESESKPTVARFNLDLAAAVRDAQPTDDSVCVPLEIAKNDIVAHLSLVWPVTQFGDSLTSTGSESVAAAARVADEKPTKEDTVEHSAEENTASLDFKPAAPAKLPKHRRLIYRNLEDGIRQLPAYAQSLMRVQVPVTVTLAEAKTPVSKILDMGPGTILQFKKACDSNLTLEVGRQTVAEGEAVKVGDKFGLWITTMTMPGERFWSVSKTATVNRVK